MSERPILFTGPMVRAIMTCAKCGKISAEFPCAHCGSVEFLKTQTRRVMKPQPLGFDGPLLIYPGDAKINEGTTLDKVCPYGWSGDRLWVRETWAKTGGCYGPDGEWMDDGPIAYMAGHDLGWNGVWRPSIHMPRAASRLLLEVLSVRVERVQNISEADAKAEGATSRPKCYGYGHMYDGWSMDWSRVGKPSKWAMRNGILSESDISLASPKAAFGSFINELHGGRYWNLKPNNLWDTNPWIWVINFKRIGVSAA